DSKNLEYQIKHVMITCLILNDINNLQISEQHYNIALYPGIKDYQILQEVLILLIQDLQDILYNGIIYKWAIKIGLFNKQWDQKDIKMLINNHSSCPEHIQQPLFFMIPLEN
ncbi:2675_t:CDS:2, partial [Gigaspora margarita]